MLTKYLPHAIKPANTRKMKEIISKTAFELIDTGSVAYILNMEG